MTFLDPKRILIACQGGGKDPFIKEAEYLFKSLNHFGGKLADSQKIVCFTEPIESMLIERFTKIGVEVKITEDGYQHDPYANKIQMLKLSKEIDFDFLIALDTDMVILDDFSNLIDEEKIGAPIDDSDALGIENWKTLFKYFQIQFPTERCVTRCTMIETIPYFNTCTLLIPKKYLSKLCDVWNSFAFKLLKAYEEFPEIGKHSWFNNQIAFALSLQESGLPYNVLPPEMNFSTHLGAHKNSKPEDLTPALFQYRNRVSKEKPFLIHHHHRVTKSGYIRYCYYDNINRFIDKVNLSVHDGAEMIVDNIYIDILHRPADLWGLEHFSSLLENGKMTVQDVRRQLQDSDEYRNLIKHNFKSN